MYLAQTGIYRARWTDQIHDEWIRNLLAKRPDIPYEKLSKVRELMDRSVPGALVTGYEALVKAIELPDPDDRHVVAAAIQTRAEAIITFNLKDFPAACLDRYSIQAVHPDQFIADQFDMDAANVIKAARNHRSSLKKPPFTPEAYLDCLMRQELPQTVNRLSSLAYLI